MKAIGPILYTICLVVASGCALPTGMLRSRWAMDDPEYDGFTDERGEDKERFSGFLASVYPEVGGHFWWTPNLRLTAFGRYMVTTEGRAADDWLIGGGLAFFTN